jgi:ribosomal-protein-alanine N-acetyltransferase
VTQIEPEIVTASWRDLRPIVALEKICFGRDSWPWMEILAALSLPGTIRLKAERNEEILGFVIGDRRARKDVGWVASIGVHPTYRRRGIGRQLLAACEQQLGSARIRLSLRRSNEHALALYRQVGYAQVGVWPEYYRDGEDALVMERVLPA